MQSTQLERHRRVLESLLARLRPDVSSINEQTRSPSNGQVANELSNAPFHLGDMGTEEFLFDMNATLLENEEYLANEVRAALGRVKDGTYGKCEQCGRDIAQERLQALPYVRHCIRCADSAREGGDVNFNKGRPQDPDDTLSPEGEMGEYRGRDEESRFTDLESEVDKDRNRSDVHAAGTPGGGGAYGGLAGTNEGRGDPNVSELEDSMGSGNSDVSDARDSDPDEPKSGRSGGAVGGTPAGKRAR